MVPDLWSRWFSADPAVRAVANRYLGLVGPAFPSFGFGLTLYFASQGSGKVLGPVLAATARLALIVGVGLWLASRHADADAFFWLIADGRVGTNMHLAIAAATRELVNRFYDTALAVGGTSLHAPAVHPEYHRHYYGAFLLDPDGINLEAVCHRPAPVE